MSIKSVLKLIGKLDSNQQYNIVSGRNDKSLSKRVRRI